MNNTTIPPVIHCSKCPHYHQKFHLQRMQHALAATTPPQLVWKDFGLAYLLFEDYWYLLLGVGMEASKLLSVVIPYVCIGGGEFW
jgi:hypothetical protein